MILSEISYNPTSFRASRLWLGARLPRDLPFRFFFFDPAIVFLGALFAECISRVELSGHRSPAAPCTAVNHKQCLSGIIGYQWRNPYGFACVMAMTFGFVFWRGGWGIFGWRTSSTPVLGWCLSPRLGYRLVAELKLFCRCTALFSTPVLGWCLSPHLGFASWRSLNYFAASRH